MSGCKTRKMRKLRNIYSLLALPALMLAAGACQKVELILSPDGGKTPLEFAALVSTGFTEIPQTKSAQTKAEDTKFDKNDKLYTYLQHVDGTTEVQGFSKLCDITVNSSSSGTLNNWAQTNPGLTANNLYWEDFTNAQNDIRTEGHGLRSYYAFCFNGGTPSPNITIANPSTEAQTAIKNGEVSWTIQTNQSTDNGFKNSDLLMAPTTEKEAYKHSTTSQMNGQHGVIPLNFTHAMSKITVEVVADNSFSGTIFSSDTKITLKGVNTTCTVTAPTRTLSAYGTRSDAVVMKPGLQVGNKKSFSAVIAPTVIKGGGDVEHAIEFASLENIGGYNYKLMLTKHAIETAPSGTGKVSWSSQLASSALTAVTPDTAAGYDSTNGGLTKPGVNYLITVHVSRTGIEVSATITNWTSVDAEETGKIQFTDSFTTEGSIDESLKSRGFDVYAKRQGDASYGGVASIVTWNETQGKWVYNPQLYWPSGSYKSYFRALAPHGEDINLEAGDYVAAKDVLWGVNSAETGTGPDGKPVSYNQGDAINTRVGKIPLSFYHAMAKITFNLIDAHADDPSGHGHGTGHGHGADPHLNLAGAKIALYNLAKTGTLDLQSGNTTPGEMVAPLLEGYYAANDTSAPEGANVLKDYLVIPQRMLTGDPYAEITLADGTKYKMMLRNSISETPGGDYGIFNEWKRGTDYTYNVYLSKEAIVFRALIQDWDKKIGSGIADLEWD